MSNKNDYYTFSLKKLPSPVAIFNKMEYKYPLKYPNPEKDIVSIVGIPTMEECRIFSQGGKPVFISDIASFHYGVSSLDELINKSALVFRRFRDETDNYEEPWVWCTYKTTIKEFKHTGRFDSAVAVVENETGIIEELVIHRICIDWEYKKLK